MVSGRASGDGLPLTLRPVQYTVAPASASARAMPRPAPRVAPATSATRPLNGWREVFFADMREATVTADLRLPFSVTSRRPAHPERHRARVAVYQWRSFPVLRPG